MLNEWLTGDVTTLSAPDRGRLISEDEQIVRFVLPILIMDCVCRCARVSVCLHLSVCAGGFLLLFYLRARMLVFLYVWAYAEPAS